jgi:hypothetical protein
MTAGRKPTPTWLKLISGGGDCHRERLRDDKPKTDAPRACRQRRLSPRTSNRCGAWLLEHIYIPHVHGSADALLFTKTCKLWARANLSALRDCRSHRERFDGI